jgi:nicotinate-nucleotide adenylyltransferase
MKIGLFFGSFNPIHVGHLILANYIVENSDLNQIWFVVSPKNPLKDKKDLLPEYHRIALVKEAIDDNPKMYASNIEFNLKQPNYTVKTLLVLNEKYPNYNFSLIIGEDNLKTFHKWYNYEYIIDNYKIFVYPRIDKPNEIKNKTEKYIDIINNSNIIFLKNAPLLSISSSYIRNEIKNKKNVKYLLTPPVLKYIDEMGFYK